MNGRTRSERNRGRRPAPLYGNQLDEGQKAWLESTRRARDVMGRLGDSREAAQRGAIALAIPMDPENLQVPAVESVGGETVRGPLVFSLLDIPAGDNGISYFGKNERTTMLARRHLLSFYDGQVTVKPLMHHNAKKEPEEKYWDLSYMPRDTTSGKARGFRDDRGCVINSPLEGVFRTHVAEDQGKVFLLVDDHVVAHFEIVLLEGDNDPCVADGAYVVRGSPLFRFKFLQDYCRLHDSQCRFPVADFVSRAPQGYILTASDCEEVGGIFNRLQDLLTDVAVHRYAQVAHLRAGRPQPAVDEPGCWLPRPYTFRPLPSTDSPAASAERLVTDLTRELGPGFIDYFVEALEDGIPIRSACDCRLAGHETLGGSDGAPLQVRLVTEDNDKPGRLREHRLPRTAQVIERERCPAGELLARCCPPLLGVTAKTVDERLVQLCDGQAEAAQRLKAELVRITLADQIIAHNSVSGRPGARIPARFLANAPAFESLVWDLTPCLPFYDPELQAAILPVSLLTDWRDMVLFVDRRFRLDFTPRTGRYSRHGRVRHRVEESGSSR